MGQQQTLGGTLTGNKYLGYIDSKPFINFQATGGENGKPLPLDIDKTIGNITENALLKEDSRYRSYEIVGSNGNCELTPDKKWARNSYYNPVYDAYDGDFTYDIYRNAFILFDHNIKPSVTSNGEAIDGEPDPKTPKAGNKRKTPIIPWDSGDENVKSYTQDMYGDGYVLIYNIMPDGDTLGFVEKSYDSVTGLSNNSDKKGNNYSYNLLKVKRVPTSAIKACFDNGQFNVSGDTIKIRSLNAEEIEVAGTAQTIINDKVTANRVLITNADSFAAASGIAVSELNQLSGIGSLKRAGSSEFCTIKTKFDEIDTKLGEISSVGNLNTLVQRVNSLEARMDTFETKLNENLSKLSKVITWPDGSAAMEDWGGGTKEKTLNHSYLVQAQVNGRGHFYVYIDGYLHYSHFCGDTDANGFPYGCWFLVQKGSTIKWQGASKVRAWKLFE